MSRTQRAITYNGRTQSATAWAREAGITYPVLRRRLQRWPLERALTTPALSTTRRAITYNGQTRSATAWARDIGVTYRTLSWRLRHWPLGRALTTPALRHGNQGRPSRQRRLQ